MYFRDECVKIFLMFSFQVDESTDPSCVSHYLLL